MLIEAFKGEAGLVFTVETLEFLACGGRIGRAQAWAALHQADPHDRRR